MSHAMQHPTGMQLYDTQGQRLYLNVCECEAFRKAAEKAPREVRTDCHLLLYTGCRPSEALAVEPGNRLYEVCAEFV
jgi:hypothetical protein